jgi:hypothetical protein
MTLLFGYLLPTLGMPSELRVPVFLGTVIMINLGTGFSTCMSVANDIRTTKLVYYHLSLPVSPAVVMSAYVAGCMMRMFSIAIPVGILGLCGMGALHELSPALLPLLAILVLTAAFFALSFLVVSIWLPFRVIMSSAWPRLFYPFFSLGAAFYTYEGVTTHVPVMRYILRCNPVTYCNEGLRSCLLGGSSFLPVSECTTFLLITCVGLFFLLVKMSKKYLHVVTKREAV